MRNRLPLHTPLCYFLPRVVLFSGLPSVVRPGPSHTTSLPLHRRSTHLALVTTVLVLDRRTCTESSEGRRGVLSGGVKNWSTLPETSSVPFGRTFPFYSVLYYNGEGGSPSVSSRRLEIPTKELKILIGFIITFY